MNNSMQFHKKRLRDRYWKTGLNGFQDYEVLELMLSYSIVRKDTKQLAKKLIDRFGNLTNIINAPNEIILSVDGMGERSVTLLKLFKDVGVYQKRELIFEKPIITEADHVYEYLMNYFHGMKIEEFKIIYLNNKNEIIDEETLFSGTVNETKIYIRKLLEHTIRNHATGIIIVHNHPTGNLSPSRADIAITNKIKESLSLIDVRLLDHIIIGQNDFISFNRKQLL